MQINFFYSFGSCFLCSSSSSPLRLPIVPLAFQQRKRKQRQKNSLPPIIFSVDFILILEWHLIFFSMRSFVIYIWFRAHLAHHWDQNRDGAAEAARKTCATFCVNTKMAIIITRFGNYKYFTLIKR